MSKFGSYDKSELRIMFIEFQSEKVKNMYSDKWLKLGYKHGERNKVSTVADYEIWKDNKNNIIGVTVNFEEADDYHYELPIEEWTKLFESVLNSTDLTNTEKLFQEFSSQKNEMFDFQDALDLHGVKYDKIAFY